jgi:hypothetical protein
MGVISAILAALDLCGWLWITGFTALGITLFDFVNAIRLLSEAKGQFHQLMNGNIFQGFADLAVNTIQLQWGWSVVILGSILVIAGAAIRDPKAPTAQDDSYAEEHSIAWPLLIGILGLGGVVLIGAFVIQGPPQPSYQNHAAQIKARLFSDPSLNHLNVQVGESDGAITLIGRVPDYSIRLKVYKIAATVASGEKINDQLEVESVLQNGEPIPRSADSTVADQPDPNSREQRLIAAFCGDGPNVDACTSHELPGLSVPLIPPPDFSDQERFETAKAKCAPKFREDNRMLVYCIATIYAGLPESQSSR